MLFVRFLYHLVVRAVAFVAGLFRAPKGPLRHGPGTWRLPEVPVECPVCFGVLVRQASGEEWVCVGFRSREEIEGRLIPHLPPKAARIPADVKEMKPCGWKGLAAEYGTKWA